LGGKRPIEDLKR